MLRFRRGSLATGQAPREPLEQLGLTAKALREIGLGTADVKRIYRCLYVHALGLHDLVQDVTALSAAKPARLITPVWKAFVGVAEEAFQAPYGSWCTDTGERNAQLETLLDSARKELEDQEQQLQELQATLREEQREKAAALSANKALAANVQQLATALDGEQAALKSIAQKFSIEVHRRADFQAQALQLAARSAETSSALATCKEDIKRLEQDRKHLHLLKVGLKWELHTMKAGLIRQQGKADALAKVPLRARRGQPDLDR
eukprot:scaffold3586_cov404-Prasinococcus_capsulatus_cf.AAC.22